MKEKIHLSNNCILIIEEDKIILKEQESKLLTILAIVGFTILSYLQIIPLWLLISIALIGLLLSLLTPITVINKKKDTIHKGYFI